MALTPAGAQAADPAGSNGFVKVDGAVFDNSTDNDPHQGCTFSVDFYNFDTNDGDAKVTFTDQAPTADAGLTVTTGDLTPMVGGDPAGGGKDLDASQQYTLSFTGDPQPQQGYHVKLTVTYPGPNEQTFTKYKVFWVQGCGETTTSTTTSSTTTGSTTTTSTSSGGSSSTTSPTAPVIESDTVDGGWGSGWQLAGLGLAAGGSVLAGASLRYRRTGLHS